MPDFSSAVKKLEFETVVRRITNLATSIPGKGLCQQIAPTNDAVWIEDEHRRVHEAKELLVAEGTIPLDGLKDIRPSLRKTAIEHQILSPAELLDIAHCLRLARILTAFLQKRKAITPGLAEFIPRLHPDKVLEFNIADAIDESGQVRDSASRELKTVRSDITGLRDQLRKRLASILRSVADQEIAQEEIITTRDGRFVIPVKAEFKNRVSGFIHSTSASGATVFIEPAETLDLNNAIRELQFREQREIDRILGQLTSQVGIERVPLEETLSTLARMDMIAAKARYSVEILGNIPKLTREVALRIHEARHPVLLQTHTRESVVPLSLEMRRDVRTLIITGPNAGGKSVAMKTVGLISLMAQSGIHVPASPDSELPLFNNILVDIGDDQSVENDLSTFSSHLGNLRLILEHADRNSLVLIDEIGAGTDPAEGGALASAILRTLHERGTFTVATTHHGVLKVFAHQTPGMANGSMEFDQSTLTPTYRFRFGIPGSSYALELAERMGFDAELLREARQFLGDRKTKLESLIVALEQEVENHRTASSSAEETRRKMEELKTSYEEKLSAVREEIRIQRRATAAELSQLLKDAQARIEQTIKEIREHTASKESIKQAKETLKNLSSPLAAQTEETSMEPDLREGDAVRLKGTTEVGELIRLESGSATVLWKNGTMKVKPGDLERCDEKRENDHATFLLPDTDRELDLRGLSGDEAVGKVQKFLDDAYVSGLHRVDIIHGKGTGVLRKRIAELLKDYPHVKEFRLGEWNEGGSGVTVVELSER